MALQSDHTTSDAQVTMLDRISFPHTLIETILELMDLLKFIICLSQWLSLQKWVQHIIGYLEITLSHGPPKEARVFCSCCLDVVTSLQGTSVAWSPGPAGVYSFWSVIQLTQTVSIYRQDRATAPHADGLGVLPEASRAREVPTLGRDMLAPGVCSEGT